jgi:hypothetical protein
MRKITLESPIVVTILGTYNFSILQVRGGL